MLDLSQEEANEFLINSNHIMQLLDEKDESPFKTFDYVAKFAGMLKSYKNEHFMPGYYEPQGVASCGADSDRADLRKQYVYFGRRQAFAGD